MSGTDHLLNHRGHRGHRGNHLDREGREGREGNPIGRGVIAKRPDFFGELPRDAPASRGR